MGLYFSDEKYKEKALNASSNEGDSGHSKEDAFLLLIKDVDKEDLSNLTLLMQAYFEYTGKDISIDECYELTQGRKTENIDATPKTKNAIYKLAYFCIEKGKPLGTKTIMDGKINTSDWIAHSLFEGKLAGQLASKMRLDEEKATVLGILHDYGRKRVHTFEHVIKGFEELTDKGWEQEAIGCLTHSFLAGGKCACNEPAEEGFYLDEEGNACWKEDAVKDDVSLFLDKYQYTKYDIILNIADLMATSYDIVSPSERIIDIAGRRPNIDSYSNRGYFLATFRNKLLEVMEEMGCEIPKDMKYELKATSDISLQKIKEEFEDASDLFYSEYQRIFEDEGIGERNRERIKYHDEGHEGRGRG